jgi:histone-lysine N-methyltransferase MLL3
LRNWLYRHLIVLIGHFTETPKLSSQAQFYMDGVCLSEMGLHQIKSLTLEQQQQSRKKRITKKIPTKADKEAGILATIESVVAGGSLGMSLSPHESCSDKAVLIE